MRLRRKKLPSQQLASRPDTQVGQIVIRRGWATEQQVAEADALEGRRVGDALVHLGYITRRQCEIALLEQRFRRGELTHAAYAAELEKLQ